VTFGFVGREERRIEDLQPAGKRPVATTRDHKKVACTGCGNIGEPQRLRLVSEEFLLSGFEEFPE
jgi:hypothetical protein